MKQRNPYSIAVDFDGVIHSYTSPWTKAHEIPDPPVVGAILWLSQMVQDFNVWILSTRCKTFRGRRAVRAYIKQHAGNLWYPDPTGCVPLEEIRTTCTKPPCLIYIDDRGYRFEGNNFPNRQTVHELRPWNKRT